eukprot:scaffold2077_cov119-Cylindrotheca_fusiformis.AAC.10
MVRITSWNHQVCINTLRVKDLMVERPRWTLDFCDILVCPSYEYVRKMTSRNVRECGSSVISIQLP